MAFKEIRQRSDARILCRGTAKRYPEDFLRRISEKSLLRSQSSLEGALEARFI